MTEATTAAPVVFQRVYDSRRFGENVANAQNHRGLSTPELSAMSGLSIERLKKVLRGDAQNPSLAAVSGLASALNYDQDTLVYGVINYDGSFKVSYAREQELEAQRREVSVVVEDDLTVEQQAAFDRAKWEAEQEGIDTEDWLQQAKAEIREQNEKEGFVGSFAENSDEANKDVLDKVVETKKALDDAGYSEEFDIAKAVAEARANVLGEDPKDPIVTVEDGVVHVNGQIPVGDVQVIEIVEGVEFIDGDEIPRKLTGKVHELVEQEPSADEMTNSWVDPEDPPVSDEEAEAQLKASERGGILAAGYLVRLTGQQDYSIQPEDSVSVVMEGERGTEAPLDVFGNIIVKVWSPSEKKLFHGIIDMAEYQSWDAADKHAAYQGAISAFAVNLHQEQEPSVEEMKVDQFSDDDIVFMKMTEDGEIPFDEDGNLAVQVADRITGQLRNAVIKTAYIKELDKDEQAKEIDRLMDLFKHTEAVQVAQSLTGPQFISPEDQHSDVEFANETPTNRPERDENWFLEATEDDIEEWWEGDATQREISIYLDLMNEGKMFVSAQDRQRVAEHREGDSELVHTSETGVVSEPGEMGWKIISEDDEDPLTSLMGTLGAKPAAKKAASPLGTPLIPAIPDRELDLMERIESLEATANRRLTEINGLRAELREAKRELSKSNAAPEAILDELSGTELLAVMDELKKRGWGPRK